jgi:hypothetical protein
MTAKLLAFPQRRAQADRPVRTAEHVPFAERLVTRRLAWQPAPKRSVRSDRFATEQLRAA